VSPAAFALVLSSVLLNAAAQLCLKAGTRVMGTLEISASTLVTTAFNVAMQPFILAGLACYVLSVAIWIVALSRAEVSVAYPMLSIGYVVNAFAASWLFAEQLNAMRLSGIVIILIGVFVLARS